jgi:hypothetical protein
MKKIQSDILNDETANLDKKRKAEKTDKVEEPKRKMRKNTLKPELEK